MADYDLPVLSADDRRWPGWAEALLIAAVGVLAVQNAYVGAGATLFGPDTAVAAVGSLSLAVRYRVPVVTVVVTVAAAIAVGALLPLLVMLFYLASRGWRALGCACAAVALAGNWFAQPEQLLWTTRAYGPVLPFALVMVLGLWVDSRRRLVASLTAQVDHLRIERELRAKQARLSERARIAAEMHDVLAHRLSLLALHAGALQRRAASLPEPVADRLALLRTTSTEALGDLRDVLGVLRDPDHPELQGQRVPGLRELPALFDEARAAGQEIEAVVEGTAAPLPASHRLAVHRLVQEALTNARKHAPGAPVHVTVRYGPPASTVEVRNRAGDPSPEGAPVSSGYGLVGLAERVTALGGRLDYGPAGGGGWSIAADIPLEDHLAPGAA